MPKISAILEANKHYAETFPGSRPLRPALQLTVVTCMDSRLDLFAALGLDIGDAHLIRNAGGVVTDDVLRSLALSQRALGTREVMIIHHTTCGMDGFDDAEFRRTLTAESGVAPGWDVPGFGDMRTDLAKDIRAVRECRWLPHRDAVRGFIFDVATGELEEVVA